MNYVAVKRDVTYERQVEEQLRQSQRLEAIVRLAGGIAHDFNNILSIIKGHAELVEVLPGLPPAARAGVDEISRAADRAATLTRQLLLFSRRQTPQLSTVDLNAVVANVSRMLTRIVGDDIRVTIDYAESPLTVHADAGMIDQVLLNLAVNSRDAMPQGGVLKVAVSACEVDQSALAAQPDRRLGRYACLAITDGGEGIAPDVLPHVFDPFYTTKGVGKGTGLGLAAVLGIVQQHGGWVDVQSQLGRGTTVRVYLPRAEREPRPTADRPPQSAMPGGENTILLAEDDVALRRLVRTILVDRGYRVLEASSGRDAIVVWTQHQQEVKLLLTDLVMPDGMSGLELARLLQGHNPALKVIYSSGYSADVAAQQVSLAEGVNFLSKPYSPQTLVETVHAALREE
jgi:nitrogen-specific signal transduction histidine kinase/CheY-like chemotaxis protein